MRYWLIFICLFPVFLLAQNPVKYSVKSGETSPGVSSNPNVDSFNGNMILQKAPNPATKRPEKKAEAGRNQQNYSEVIIPTGSFTPHSQISFTGNNFDFRVPNDNSIAISNGGKVVSAINATVNCFDNIGKQIDAFSLDELANPLGLNQIKYDPRVIYDPGSDRFVLVYLNGQTDSTSKVIVAFSSTNNPADSWQLYALPGNVDSTQLKSDFPAISITNDHLYITVNTFDQSSGDSEFKEGIIWKVDKERGYEGLPLSYRYIDGIAYDGSAFFSLYPVRPGSELFGPDMYFVGNRGTQTSNDSIFLLKLLHRPNDGDTLILHPLVSPLEYHYPPLAQQPASKTLETNDSRITGAFLNEDCLQLVATTAIPQKENSGIFHGIIWNASSSQPTIDANIINVDSFYCGYPNIASTATKERPYGSVIIFNYSTPKKFPGFASLFYDNEQPYSKMVVLKAGESSVTVQPADINRWGDYTGIQPQYNDTGTVWVAGSYGKNSTHNTWISKVKAPDFSSAAPSKSMPEVKTYPNPFANHVRLQFSLAKPQKVTVELLTASGEVKQIFLNGFVEAGDHTFTFSPAPLAAGTYLLSIRGEKGQLLRTKKVIKQ